MTRIAVALAVALALALSCGAAHAADLSLIVDRSSIRSGDFVVYTIHVAGPGEVTDTFEFGGTVNYLSAGCRDAGNRTVVCTATAPNTTFAVSVRYSEVGSSANTATWGRERATVTIDVRPRFGDLAISGAAESSLTVGTVARFTLTGTNQGPDAMRNIVASAEVRGATIVAVPLECSLKAAMVTCRWPDLTPGGTMASSFSLKAAGVGTVRVSFSIRSTDVETDASNNDGTALLAARDAPPPPPPPGGADLAFSMQPFPIVNAGDAFTLDAAVENRGPDPAANVRISFPYSYPTVEEITSPGMVSCVTYSGGSECRLPLMLQAGGHVSLTLHLRAPGGLATLSSSGRITPDHIPTFFGGGVTSDTYDPDLANNSSLTAVTIIYPPAVSFAPSEPRFRLGDLARYSIRIASGSGDVVVEHVPPPGLNVIFANPTNG